jgi:methionine--tRNA ligase beta chain
MITFDDFKKVELVTAKVLEVEDHPDADRLYVLQVDIGEEKRQIIAGIKAFYTKEELLGKTVVMVKNLEPATIRGVESNGMILAVKDENNLSVLTTEKDITIGNRAS